MNYNRIKYFVLISFLLNKSEIKTYDLTVYIDL